MYKQQFDSVLPPKVGLLLLFVNCVVFPGPSGRGGSARGS